MKTFLINLYRRLGYIRALLTAKSFVLLVHHRSKKTGKRRNQLHTNMKQDEYMACILREAGTYIYESSKATNSLINSLGIKRSEDK